MIDTLWSIKLWARGMSWNEASRFVCIMNRRRKRKRPVSDALWSTRLWIKGMSWHEACRFVCVMKAAG